MYKPSFSPDRFFHWIEIDVRFRDLDPLNHVNNSVYNTYLEEARISFIREVPEFRKSMAEGRSFILAHIELSYLKPVQLGETILVGSSIKELGNSSIKGFQAIYSKETRQLKSVAETTGVWFDLKAKKPDRIPDIINKEKYIFKFPSDGQE
jgi:acyl-CoA thioester hydrolase